MTNSYLPPHRVPNLPQPQDDWALFLDLDGTLLDIAPSPDRVTVPVDLIRDLANASEALGGALAIVSGRMLSEIDGLLSPLRLPTGGEHGAVLRLPDGRRDEVDSKVPSEWIDVLVQTADTKAGIFIERKIHSVVAHYRRAAHYEDFCRQLCLQLIAGRADAFEVLQCKMAIEIRPRAANKARPVQRLMKLEPFLGRRPVFVGDDVTDEDGFRAAIALGGEGYDVMLRFAGRPKLVRDWLKTIADLPSRRQP